MNLREKKLLYLTASHCGEHRFAGVADVRGNVVHDINLFFSKHLNHIFSKVIDYDYLRRYFDCGPSIMKDEIIEIVKREKPDFVLWQSLSLHYEIEEAIFRTIKDYGCKLIGIFWDDEVVFDSFTKNYLPFIDYYLTTDPNSVSRSALFGIQGYLLDSGADSEIHRELDIPYEYDVSFVGTRFLEREKAINRIKKAGIDIKVFGNGWNRILSLTDMVKVFNKSRINMNFTTNAINKNKRQIKGRFFEVCMSGGFLLSEYVEGIERCYEPGREIVCFKAIDEAIEKIRFYLSHEGLRKEIAQRGYERSLIEHSWLNRLTGIFEKVMANEKVNFRRPAFSINNKPSGDNFNVSSSQFHLKWAIALLLKGDFKEQNMKSRYFDELNLALKYNPYSIGANFLYLIRFLPIASRRMLVGFYLRCLIAPLKYAIALVKTEGSLEYKLRLIRDKLSRKYNRASVWAK